MSQPSEYILRTPIHAIQYFAVALHRQPPQIIRLVGDDAKVHFSPALHVDIEFDDDTVVTANNGDFIVRIGEDIEVFSEEDFHALFIRLG